MNNDSSISPMIDQIGRNFVSQGLAFFRLAHLEDAFKRATGIRTALSIGSGGGLHEVWLALMNPDITVTAIDLRLPKINNIPKNCHFIQGNIFNPQIQKLLPKVDFVYSIECLEHIEDDMAAFHIMASCLNPNAWLYLQVPFATEADQNNPELCRIEYQQNEHVRPGYDVKRLKKMASDEGLTIQLYAGAFHFPLTPLCIRGMKTIDSPYLGERWRVLYELFKTDVREGPLPRSRSEATGIKILAHK